MPSEATINEWWLIASACAFLATAGVFATLAQAIRRQYDMARTPLTELARALVRQKAAIAVFALAWSVVVGVAAGRAVFGWEVEFWWRMAYRAVAFGSIVGVAIEGFRVKWAMDRDERRVVRRVETGRAEGHAAGMIEGRAE